MPKGVYERSEETREKIRLAKLGENNPMYGKHWRPNGLTMLGRHHSNETKEKLRQMKLCDRNPNWKDGIVHSGGYIHIYKPDHYFCNSRGYVKEHRLKYEEYHNCCLLKWAIIHHRNGDRMDQKNENLEVMTQNKHMSLHMKKS